MNADGSDQRVIFSGAGYFNPAWSPDGPKIAVANDAIYIIIIDGSSGFFGEHYGSRVHRVAGVSQKIRAVVSMVKGFIYSVEYRQRFGLLTVDGSARLQ